MKEQKLPKNYDEAERRQSSYDRAIEYSEHLADQDPEPPLEDE